MRRVPLLLVPALLLLVAFFAGYLLRGPGPSAPVGPDGAPVQSGMYPSQSDTEEMPEALRRTIETAPVLTGEAAAGWCCTATSPVCTRAPTTGDCLNNGGRLFNQEQQRCDTACAFLQTR